MLQVLRRHLGTALAVDGGGDDAAGVACSLATGEETVKADMLEGEVVAEDADRTGRAGLCGDECGFIGKEAVALTTKDYGAGC